MMIEKIISGGQTGADRAALDWAIWRNLPHSGWCPKGRKALDGPLDSRYNLKETPTANYLQRTEWNARDSDGTVIFTLSPELSGGSRKTGVYADKHQKPWIHIHSARIEPQTDLSTFVTDNSISSLNVAGSRESKEPGLYEWVKQILDETFFPVGFDNETISGSDEGK